jgi:hypothetical protein
MPAAMIGLRSGRLIGNVEWAALLVHAFSFAVSRRKGTERLMREVSPQGLS